MCGWSLLNFDLTRAAMKNPRVQAIALSFTFAGVNQAAAPHLLPIQFRLTEANDSPVADWAKVVRFKINDAPAGFGYNAGANSAPTRVSNYHAQVTLFRLS